MAINPFSTFRLAKKNVKLAEKLQSEMDANFFEHAMYDINDALTSILALCDIEQMKGVPKVKGYIQRVNELLNDVQVYQDEKIFNVNHLLRNVIDIINDSFNSEVKILTSFVVVKALVKSNQKQIESILLYLLVELIMIPNNSEKNNIHVELSQKDNEVQIMIRREDFSFSHEQLKEASELRENFTGKMEILKKGNGVSISISLPLSFKTSSILRLLPTATTSTIKVISDKKSALKSIKSFFKNEV